MRMSQERTDSGPVLLYDGECPFCSRYVQLVRLRETVGPLRLVNARERDEWYQRARSLGLNVDQGMVLFHGNRVYHGAECIRLLAMMSTRVGWFNRLNALLFSTRAGARVLYPMLKFGRRIALWLLRRRPLD